MPKELADNKKNMRLTDAELALFTATMKRDGMSQLTTWMKSICSKYATGQLVPLSMASSDDKIARLLLKQMAANDGKMPFGMTVQDTSLKDEDEG